MAMDARSNLRLAMMLKSVTSMKLSKKADVQRLVAELQNLGCEFFGCLAVQLKFAGFAS
jgi:hypothetical protein